jgi:hypothetical protein
MVSLLTRLCKELETSLLCFKLLWQSLYSLCVKMGASANPSSFAWTQKHGRLDNGYSFHLIPADTTTQS